MSRLVVGLAAVAVAALAWMALRPGPPPAETVTVTLPALSAEATAGRALFNANCAACHGENAAGSDQGPPLIHVIYEPSHHGDMAFLLAAQNGVVAHHWRFGNMPPVPGVSPDEVVQIVTYVREIQRANGIH